jgi:signal transduction histidine kinase
MARSLAALQTSENEAMALALTDRALERPAGAQPTAGTPGGNLANQRISALGEMTAGLAHDFRTILAVIQSGVNVARRAGADAPKRDLALAAVDEAVRRGARLTEELLVFARGGRPDVHTEDINDLLAGSATFMKYGAGPGIRIALDLAPTLPECRLDPAQFNAAILNLVVNARDAMPDGGEIRIATDECRGPCGDVEKTVERWVRVRITDQGSGMPPEVLEHLFEPYFTTKGDAGTGLGVPQVLAFVRASGGSVCVSSEPGVGTSFDLRFPVADAPEPPDDGLRRQLDRWTNEGGSVETALSSRARRNGRRRPAA